MTKNVQIIFARWPQSLKQERHFRKGNNIFLHTRPRKTSLEDDRFQG